MSDNFQTIDWNDDDVLLFDDKVLFKVNMFKQDFSEKINSKFNELFKKHGSAMNDFRKLSFQEKDFGFCDMNIRFNSPVIKGQILRVGANGWQKGLIRSQAIIEFDFDKVRRSRDYESWHNCIIIKDIIIEFAPEPIETL
jgi:KGK domain